MALKLPRSTEYNRRVPKNKYYDHLSLTPAQKRVFVDQIEAIYWRNKIAPSTMNLAAGTTVSEIQILEIRLTAPSLDVSILKQIDHEVPYHLLFLLEYEGKYQAWIAYKEAAASGNNAFKVGTYYHTDWMLEGELPLSAEGLDIDAVYENFVRQIAGDALQTKNVESLKESVERDERRLNIRKKIAALQVRIRNEKQLNKQVKLNAELKKLKKILEEL